MLYDFVCACAHNVSNSLLMKHLGTPLNALLLELIVHADNRMGLDMGCVDGAIYIHCVRNLLDGYTTVQRERWQSGTM